MTGSENPFDPQRRNVLMQLGCAGLAGLPLVACSSVAAFNAIVPADPGSVRVTRDIAFGSDPRQRLDVYAPDGATNLPAVLFVYGGSWNSGNRGDYAFVGRAIAARGYVAVVADYRLVPQVLYPDFVVDTGLALRWMRNSVRDYGGDPRRLFVVGHSAGAYNAVMLALNPRIEASSGVRAGDIRGVVGLAGPYDFLPLDDPSTIAAFGQWPAAGETQPVNYARRSAPSMLLLHGEADTTVYPRNSKSLADRLRRAGANVEERYYPGAGHVTLVTSLAVPFRSSAPVLDDIDRFIRQHSR